jgi:chloramphenicol 3-O-phosphotransferase
LAEALIVMGKSKQLGEKKSHLGKKKKIAAQRWLSFGLDLFLDCVPDRRLPGFDKGRVLAAGSKDRRQRNSKKRIRADGGWATIAYGSRA